MTKYGRMAVRIESATAETADWPVGGTPHQEFQEFLRRGMGASVDFVADRSDLATILASESDIRRGDLTTWLPRPSYPARLVQALIIANDTGSAALVDAIRERLRGSPLILADGTRVEIMKSAERWAREYGKALGIRVVL